MFNTKWIQITSSYVSMSVWPQQIGALEYSLYKIRSSITRYLQTLFHETIKSELKMTS